MIVLVLIIIYYCSNYKEYYGDYDTNDSSCVQEKNFYDQLMSSANGTLITEQEYNNKMYKGSNQGGFHIFDNTYCPSLTETVYVHADY